MPFTITMPKLSPTMEEGMITKWRKKVGEFVSSGEVLLEIATDKATVEHTALDEGYLKKILVAEGKTALINQAIAIFTADEKESIEGYQPKDIKPLPSQKTPPEEKKEEKFQTEIATSVTFREIPFVPQEPLKKYSFFQSTPLPVSSPLAKKIAAEKGLDLTTVKGSGPHGRIISEDLKYALPLSLVSFGKKGPPELPPGSYSEEEPSPMRKTIGKRLQAAKNSIPHFYVSVKINATNLVAMREELKRLHFENITFNDMILRASALALRANKAINMGYNNVKGTLVHFQTIDISVAVTIEGGLITPIIRHADYKNLGEISIEMRSLIEKARQGSLKEEEYLGGSFCISNLGMYGVSDFIAVLNPPQAAILAIAGILDEPIVQNGIVVAGKTLTLTLSCDHRVIDGASAALFLKTLKELLENPISLTI